APPLPRDTMSPAPPALATNSTNMMRQWCAPSAVCSAGRLFGARRFDRRGASAGEIRSPDSGKPLGLVWMVTNDDPPLTGSGKLPGYMAPGGGLTGAP